VLLCQTPLPRHHTLTEVPHCVQQWPWGALADLCAGFFFTGTTTGSSGTTSRLRLGTRALAGRRLRPPEPPSLLPHCAPLLTSMGCAAGAAAAGGGAAASGASTTGLTTTLAGGSAAGSRAQGAGVAAGGVLSCCGATGNSSGCAARGARHSASGLLGRVLLHMPARLVGGSSSRQAPSGFCNSSQGREPSEGWRNTTCPQTGTPWLGYDTQTMNGNHSEMASNMCGVLKRCG
jgi:hypothetical protein